MIEIVVALACTFSRVYFYMCHEINVRPMLIMDRNDIARRLLIRCVIPTNHDSNISPIR